MLRLHPETARTILTELALGLVVLDADERVGWANDHALQLLGVSLEALAGTHVQDLALPYAAPGAGSAAPAVAVDGHLIGFTQPLERTGGAIIAVCERSHPLVDFLGALASGLTGGVAASGVLPRAAIKGRFEAEVSRSRRYANPLSCLTVTTRGDAPAMALAGLLKEQLRWVDVLGQWDEQTLLVVLPETTAAAAAALREKLVEAFAHAAVAAPGALAIGATAWQRGDNVERMVARALAGAGGTGPVALDSCR